ncbi:MAG: hypothetical protein ACMXYB_01385 [Candidatus Woesearchaeota archaeon]
MSRRNSNFQKIHKDNLKDRLRSWGFSTEQLRTNKLPVTNAHTYIHPSLIEYSVQNTFLDKFGINNRSYLYGIEGSTMIGLSRRRTQLIENKSNQLYSPAYMQNSNNKTLCIDIDLVNDDQRVLDFLKGRRNKNLDDFRTPISHIITPFTSTIKRLNGLRTEFQRVNYTFPKIIMIPDNQSPLLLTKSSKKPTVKYVTNF